MFHPFPTVTKGADGMETKNSFTIFHIFFGMLNDVNIVSKEIPAVVPPN
jgi:hypothetical protein